MGGGSDVPAEKPMWRADPAWRQWGIAGRTVDKQIGAGRPMFMNTKWAGRVVDMGGSEKVARGGEEGRRNGGRWHEGPRNSRGGKGTSDRWGGGRCNEGHERDNSGRKWIGGEGIFVNVWTCEIIKTSKFNDVHFM